MNLHCFAFLNLAGYMDLMRDIVNFFRPYKFLGPASYDEIPAYESAFEQAIKFTKRLGVLPRQFDCNLGRDNILDRDGLFLEPVFKAAGITDPRQSAGQCLKWCHYLQPHFEKHLKRSVVLTIGQLWHGQSCVFGPSFEDVRRWIEGGLHVSDLNDGEGFRLHAWLTVESGEIIEPTLLSTLAAFANDAYKQFAGGVVWGRDPTVLNSHRYFPMAVGHEMVERIASRSTIPLLARTAGELSYAGVILVNS